MSGSVVDATLIRARRIQMKPNFIEVGKDAGVEDEVIGLRFSKVEGVSFEVARKGWEHAIRAEMMRRGMTDEQWENEPFVTIEFSCGGKVVYQRFDDIPCENVPCSCGNPKHWFVKYTEIVADDGHEQD